MEGARIVDYALPGPPPDLSSLSQPGTVVLFPSPHAPRLEVRPRQVVVIDATWAQARRMVQRIPALRTLPRLSLPARPARPTRQPMRLPTVAGGLSTIDAMAAALELLGEQEAGRSLRGLHEAALVRAWRLRGGATRGRCA